MSAKSIRFFVAMHKCALLPKIAPHFAALGVGGFRPATSLLAFSDDTGDSISRKNLHYSELTGWYWIWKNVRDVDVVGLCHYRRYFVFDAGLQAHGARGYYVPPTEANLATLTAPPIAGFVEAALTAADVIVPRRLDLVMSMSQQYVSSHRREDWNLFLEAIHENCPDLRSSVPWFDLTREGHPYNMMVASKSFFDTYMCQLFAVMSWMERQRPFPTEPYQCRVPSFLAERFFSLYLHATRARRFEVPVAILDNTAF